jgi:plasmid stabilization system protein ParE
MELKIFWTNFSKQELKKIFDYYKLEANLNVAKSLVGGIAIATSKLIIQPEIGQEEELLKVHERNFRYFLFKNYKIIYLINSKMSRIEIFDIFDTRQNPTKLKRNK